MKGLFFVADDGYRDASSGGRLTCETGPDCVYQRYLAIGRGPAFEAAGITDLDSLRASTGATSSARRGRSSRCRWEAR